ncbi:hypothetical protein ACIBIZ_51495 [Nonomuraea spiralis]|uniref:hypothetical protein n=1 Tax=Nonomuraea spiralis TaxID=46182 RepID=UPI0037B31A1F
MFDWFPHDFCWIQEAWPSQRAGADPTALDPLMRDRHFQLDEPGDIFNEDPTTVDVSVTSALRPAGRLTGREIDAGSLDRTHSLYLF